MSITVDTPSALAALPDLPGEVVTEAHLRYVDLSGGAGTAALITLDNGRDHTRPTTLGPRGLRNLAAALDAASAHEGLSAIAVTGKPFVFVVGADLGMMRLGGQRAYALAVARAGHEVFRRLRESRVPTFALINGAAMGGGLELALHCRYRTMAATVPAVALPECFLGLVPGWGGCYLLPNLVGADAAVTVVLANPLSNNRTMTGPEAARLGLADAVFESADFLEQSLRWASAVVRGEVVPARRDVDRGEGWDAALARGRSLVDARTRGHAQAPYRALDLLALAGSADYPQVAAAEEEAIADLATGDQLRAGLYAFDLVQKRAKRPVGEPDPALARPVTKVGVVGAGLMAAQLALLAARRLKVPVVMTDLDQERVDGGLSYVRSEVEGLARKGRLSLDAANRVAGLVTGSTSLEPFADADWVIEAVYEELDIKREVFARLENVVGPECLLATNTSSLSVTAMAEGLRHPERVVGCHFFNPVAVLPLLEVVRARFTDDATLATAFSVGRTLGKSCVLVRDAPGFVFNRVLSRALGEVLRGVEEGTPSEVADAAVSELGMPMPPSELVGLVGPTVALHTAETLHKAFPDRFPALPGLARLVELGKPGIYVSDQRGRRIVDPEVAALWPRSDRPLPAAEILEGARAALAEEIRLLLDEGVVAEPQDVDLCLILGGGFAFWNGGITPYLDRTGVAERVTGRRFLPSGLASVPN